jgi:hypothetical protein
LDEWLGLTKLKYIKKITGATTFDQFEHRTAHPKTIMSSGTPSILLAKSDMFRKRETQEFNATFNLAKNDVAL